MLTLVLLVLMSIFDRNSCGFPHVLARNTSGLLDAMNELSIVPV